ncbi:ESPR domain-containing protein, partial [Marinobacterium lutimaris]
MYNHAQLNRVFRLVWNATLNAWCVAPETARGKGKAGSVRRLLPLTLLLGASSAWAELPQGGQISAGDGSLSYQGDQLNVQQNSDRLA